ncbi:MAG: chemotaxis protein CheV [gamma proteobacterium endosymbiont of Lamellibrachia anaximandri]|nr:chemotaxis protein CheV [gamma proteobacterium endosymbiont of Lamellibrachia anaximandri]MBL3534532.1 chemotaxis protein CheV [gamma proteobacterium endosymbiont of Lamellibrachia anaximandri]
MAGVLDGVDLRTQMAGQNRLEMLVFRLGGRQRFGINVFKVKEVVHCPPLTEVPGANPVIRGVANLRGENISVMDLGHAIGGPMMGDPKEYFVIMTEYNRRQLGFLVGSVDRIVNMNWEDILPPPKGLGRGSYMTAVTRVDDELVEILDVEKVLSEVLKIEEEASGEVETSGFDLQKQILVVDDSVVARKQIKRVLDQIGIECVLKNDGREALQQLQLWSGEAGEITDRLAMVISDIEMPKMDGYALVTAIRQDPKLAALHVVLHSSLSGVFNESMVQRVGADHFLAKFVPDELMAMVGERLQALKEASTD